MRTYGLPGRAQRGGRLLPAGVLLLFVLSCDGGGAIDLDALSPVEKVAVVADRSADRELRGQALGAVSLEVAQLGVADAEDRALLDAIASRLLTHEQCWVRAEALEQISAYARQRDGGENGAAAREGAPGDVVQRVERAAMVAADMIEAPACEADEEPVCYVSHPASTEPTQLTGQRCAQREAAYFLWQSAPLLEPAAALEPVAQLALNGSDAVLRYAAAQLLDEMHALNPNYVRGVAQRLAQDSDPHVRRLAEQLLRVPGGG